jgi:hypothetical protein
VMTSSTESPAIIPAKRSIPGKGERGGPSPWITLNRNNQPTRLAHLDGNHGAILVEGDEGPAQVVRLGHLALHLLAAATIGAISSPPAPYHLAGGARGIRTLGSPTRDNGFRVPRSTSRQLPFGKTHSGSKTNGSNPFSFRQRICLTSGIPVAAHGAAPW